MNQPQYPSKKINNNNKINKKNIFVDILVIYIFVTNDIPNVSVLINLLGKHLKSTAKIAIQVVNINIER
jgi:hypothetical protein